jgi:hypothetical protein
LPFLSYFDKLTSTSFLGGVQVLYVFLVDPLPFSSSKQKDHEGYGLFHETMDDEVE